MTAPELWVSDVAINLFKDKMVTRSDLYCLRNQVTDKSTPVSSPGIFFAILGRGPRAFQIGKISGVNHYFGKFSKQTGTAFVVS